MGAGRKVILSRSVIEHYIGDDPMQAVTGGTWLRWARGSRRSGRWGTLGEIFTWLTVPPLCSLDSRRVALRWPRLALAMRLVWCGWPL